MDLLAERRELHRRHWPAFDGFVDALPPRLNEQARLLRNEIQGFYSLSTRCEDVLLQRDDYPVTDLPVWLLADLGVGNETAQRCEEPLSRAMFFTFAGVFLREKIFDRGSLYGSEFLLLVDALERRAVQELRRVPSLEEAFWERHRTHWETYGEALLWDGAREPAPAAAEDLLVRAELWAPFKIGVAAVAFAAGRSELCAPLEALLDPVHEVLQVRRELSSIRHDLEIGRHTFPIAVTRRRSGLVDAPLVPVQVLGALVLSDAVGEITAFCQQRLERCRAAAEELGLHTVGRWLDLLGEAVTSTRGVFKATRGPDDPVKERPFFIPPQPPLKVAVGMAEDYLLDNVLTPDNREVNWGFEGHKARFEAWFPSGFLLEALGLHGHDVTGPVDACFRRHRDVHDYAYFEGPFPWPEADSLATLLRLEPFSSRGALSREVIGTMLGWARRSVLPSGRIPVWIQSDVDVDIAEERLLSEGCGTVEGNVLLGLFESGRDEDERALIEASAAQLCERFTEQGPGVNVNYSPLYNLCVMGTLLQRLRGWETSGALGERVEAAFARLRKEAERAAARCRLTPLDASLLLLLVDAVPAFSDLRRDSWTEVVLKNQAPDGSWHQEPFYFTPSRGLSLVWWQSRGLTTAFGYRALKSVERNAS